MFYTILSGCAVLAIMGSMLLPLSLFADTAKSFSDNALQASAAASQAWLGLLDKAQYGQSWDQSATITKLTINKEDWVQILEKTRRPLGAVSSREVVDQRTAQDPKGLPKGDYIVMVYKTVFSHQPAKVELVTLYLEDGKWHVVTYQVGSQ